MNIQNNGKIQESHKKSLSGMFLVWGHGDFLPGVSASFAESTEELLWSNSIILSKIKLGNFSVVGLWEASSPQWTIENTGESTLLDSVCVCVCVFVCLPPAAPPPLQTTCSSRSSTPRIWTPRNRRTWPRPGRSYATLSIVASTSVWARPRSQDQ